MSKMKKFAPPKLNSKGSISISINLLKLFGTFKGGPAYAKIEDDKLLVNFSQDNGGTQRNLPGNSDRLMSVKTLLQDNGFILPKPSVALGYEIVNDDLLKLDLSKLTRSGDK